MKAGDLIEYKKTRWRVLHLNRTTRLVSLIGLDNSKIEIPDNLDIVEPENCQVVAVPATTWHTVTAPIKKGAGKIVKLILPSLRSAPRELLEGYDWISADPSREGGSLFLNPVVGLKAGDVVLAEYLNGTRNRITITNLIGTVAQKQARMVPKEAPKPSVYDQVLFDDED